MKYGIVIVKGIGIGEVFIISADSSNIEYNSSTIEEEHLKSTKAIADLIEDLQSLKEKASDSGNTKIFEIMEVHEMLLSDEELINNINEHLNNGLDAIESIEQSARHYENIFLNMEDSYFQERAVDIRDLGNQLKNKLLGCKKIDINQIQKEIILVADEIQPSIIANADPKWIKGIVSKQGSETSHAAIMCKTIGIPFISGIDDLSILQNNDSIIVDALNNQIYINPDTSTLNRYRDLIKELEDLKNTMTELSNQNVYISGNRIQVQGNIAGPDDLRFFSNQNSDGVGLYRTEFIFLKRDNFPSESAQFDAYRTVVKAFDESPVTLRTIDIGGDKNLSYLDLGVEQNPFLGYRAIRFCLDGPYENIFRTQLRAMLRCIDYGKVKIMFPMITTVSELKRAKEILNEECENLQINPNKEQLSVGIMVEVPSVAICAELFAPYVDFFSIGTNDLTQYTLASDRMNPKLKELYSYFNPAVLKLVQNVITVGNENNIEVSMCGEMASNTLAIPLLTGMGLKCFSVSPTFINKVKYILNSINDINLSTLLDEVSLQETSGDVKYILEQFQEKYLSKKTQYL